MTRGLTTLGVLFALASPALAEPGARTLPAPSLLPTVGTAHPIRVIENATTARWAAICQARTIGAKEARHVKRGDFHVEDAMAAYLVRGGGAGQRIDEWITASNDDRWLVFLRDGALILLDDTGNRERTLVEPPVPTRRDHSHRVAVFDATSRYLAYLRTIRTIVVRELATSQERAITIPGEAIARIVPEPVGPWARVLLRRDGKDDAERRYEPPPPPLLDDDAPSPARPRLGASCIVFTSRWSYGLEGAQRWLNLATGELRADPDVQARLGDITIRRTRAGALISDGAEIVPASCAAKVRAVSLSPLRIVASCSTAGDKLSLEVFGPGGFRVRLLELEPEPDFMTSTGVMRTVQFVKDDHFCYGPLCVRLTDGQAIPTVERKPRAVRLVAAEPGPNLRWWDLGPLRWLVSP